MKRSSVSQSKCYAIMLFNTSSGGGGEILPNTSSLRKAVSFRHTCQNSRTHLVREFWRMQSRLRRSSVLVWSCFERDVGTRSACMQNISDFNFVRSDLVNLIPIIINMIHNINIIYTIIWYTIKTSTVAKQIQFSSLKRYPESRQKR